MKVRLALSLAEVLVISDAAVVSTAGGPSVVKDFTPEYAVPPLLVALNKYL